MKCRPWRWLWGLLPLALIGYLAITGERARIEADLAARTSQVLAEAGFDRVTPVFEGRDGRIEGLDGDGAASERAIALADDVWGVRIAEGQAAAAGGGEGYTFRAIYKNGNIRLRGVVPSESDRRTVIGLVSANLPNANIDEGIRISEFGGPPSDVWMSGIAFGLKQLRGLRRGRFTLVGDGFSISGSAQSLDSYDEIRDAVRYDLPTGLVLTSEDVRSPNQSDRLRWTALYDQGAKTLTFGGKVRNDDVRRDVISQARRVFPELQVNDASQSDEDVSEDWDRLMVDGLRELAQLEAGELVLDEDTLEIRGSATDQATADEVAQALRNAAGRNMRVIESITVRETTPALPEIRPYPVEFERFGDRVTLSGYVPDENARRRITEIARQRFPSVALDDRLDLGAGSPPAERWQAAIAFALDQLARLEDGYVRLSDLSLEVAGRVRDSATYDQVTAALRERLPTGVRLARAAIEAPVVSPFVWDAEYGGDSLRLTGYVPSNEVRIEILSFARRRFPGINVVDEMRIASGAAGQGEDWLTTVRNALRALSAVGNGRAGLSDTELLVTGRSSDPSAQQRTQQLLDDSLYRPFRGRAEITYERPDEPRLTWRLVARDRTVSISGEVPDEATRLLILDAAKREFPSQTVRDRMRISRGIADRWSASALTGLRLVARLQDGEALLNGDLLTIRGTAPDDDVAAVVRESLRGGLPEGYRGRDLLTIEPAAPQVQIVSPYRLTANARDGEIRIEGHAPDEAARSRIVSVVVRLFPGRRVINDLRIGAGHPGGRDDWLDAIETGLAALQLEGNGRLEAVDEDLTLTGETTNRDWRNGASARSLRDGLPRGFNGTVDLEYKEPPTIDWAAELERGELVLSGEVPENEANNLVRSARSVMSSVRVVDNMERVQHTPRGWYTATRVGLRALSRLRSGRLTMQGSEIDLTGVAATAEDRAASEDAVRTALPDPYRGEAQIELETTPEPAAGTPRDENQSIVVERSPGTPTGEGDGWRANYDGTAVVLTGEVPSDVIREDLEAYAKRQFRNVRIENRMVVSGEPQGGFVLAARKSLDQLAELDKGSASIERGVARLDGEAASERRRNEIVDNFRQALPGNFAPEAKVTFRETAAVREPPRRRRSLFDRIFNRRQVEEALSTNAPVEADLCQALLNSILQRGEIRFRTASARLEPESFPTLVRLTHVASRCPDARIEISGHTDSDGSETFNQGLSEQRAKAVESYLVRSGIETERLGAVGFGETRPIAPNDSDKNKALNRRIEFEVYVE